MIAKWFDRFKWWRWNLVCLCWAFLHQKYNYFNKKFSMMLRICVFLCGASLCIENFFFLFLKRLLQIFMLFCEILVSPNKYVLANFYIKIFWCRWLNILEICYLIRVKLLLLSKDELWKVGMTDTDNDLYKREIFGYIVVFTMHTKNFSESFWRLILECFLLCELESPEFGMQEVERY